LPLRWHRSWRWTRVADPLSEWLRLREPADVACRSDALTRAVRDALGGAEPVSIVDFGTGTGSNIRYLMERLGGRQRWTAVDRSADLLAELPGRVASWARARGDDAQARGGSCRVRSPRFACEIETRQRDLRLLDDDLFEGRGLVTASALLDLVPASWLRTLAARCRAVGALALFTITYNGHSTCTPAEGGDDLVRELLNRHQKTNVGFGEPAEGPDAPATAERCFIEAGYRVERVPSPWSLGPGHGDMQRLLIEGWAQAASEVAPGHAAAVARWRARRLAHVAAGRSHIVVGHDDLAAWPPGAR
jgi:hypothetical protein